MKPIITAYDWVPPFARGQVRDLRVRWALEEVGQPYDVLYLSQGAQKEAEHRARQPFGQVPTYEDGDVLLFESGAIVHYIAATYPGLLPAEAAARARAVEWMFAALNSVEPALMEHATAAVFEADQPWREARMPQVRERVDARLGDLSRRLGKSEWLDGGGFTAGDLLMVAVLRIVAGDGMLDEHPNLKAYVERGVARPAFGRALDAQLAGFTGEPPAAAREWLEKQKQKEQLGEQA